METLSWTTGALLASGEGAADDAGLSLEHPRRRRISARKTAARRQIPRITPRNLIFLRFLVLFPEVGIHYIIICRAGTRTCISGISRITCITGISGILIHLFCHRIGCLLQRIELGLQAGHIVVVNRLLELIAEFLYFRLLFRADVGVVVLQRLIDLVDIGLCLVAGLDIRLLRKLSHLPHPRHLACL